jgi:hypothetical protein
MVVVDVDADELTNPASASEAAETVDKPSGKSSKADDRPVDVDDECLRPIYFGSCGLTDVYPFMRPNSEEPVERKLLTFHTEHVRYFDDRLFFDVSCDVCHQR